MLGKPGRIYFTEDAIENTVSNFSSASGDGTVDELGFGRVYDPISADLFPWCTTLTTRALYFFSSAVILDLASEQAVTKNEHKIEFDKPESREIFNKIKTDYYDNVKKYETYLGMILLSWTATKKVEGIFGIKKLTNLKRQNFKLNESIKFGILKGRSRYPNSIYRTSMEVLGIFEKGIGTSDSAIVKRAIVRNKVREGEILHSEWKSKVQVLKSQLKNLFLTLDSQGEEKFRTIIDKVLPPAIKAVKFNGFVLEAPQKILLAKKMSGRTPYIKEIDWKKINVSQLNLTIIAEQLSKDNEYKLRIETAIKIDICTAPFRALYGYLKEHEQHKILGHDIHPRFNYPSWKKYLKDVQTSEIAMDRYKVAYINKFLNYCHDELDVSNGKVSSKLLEIVGDRATIEVAKRNKIAPHRKAKDRSDADDNILEDIGVTESSFRLDNAMTILEDVYL